MTTILTDAAKNIVDKLINLVIGETYYACCFRCIVADYEKEKEELEAKWMTIGKDVEDARKRAEDIRDDVTYWQGQAENLIKEDTKTKMACFGGWCPNCISRYHRGKELSQKVDDIRRLKGTIFESVGRVPHLPGVEYHSSQGFIHFESRNLIYDQLFDALANDSNYMTGLQGMGGSGKTTLAKEVGKKLKQLEKFDHVIFATVSNAPDIKKIQDSIAGPLGLSSSLKDQNEWQRRNILWKRLIDGEKILITLDDVWEPINFEEIGIPSRDYHKNCRILLTTRDVRVCNSMGCPRPIQLGLLSEPDAWILFQKHAGINNDSSKNLQDKGQEITKECRGLPVAVAAIASTLKDRPLEEWNAALTALQNPMSMNDVNENLIKIYTCLRYSYDNMKSEKAKNLFLLLSIFPEDLEVDVEILTTFGIGVGLFEESDKYCEARSQVLVAKNKLIDSCLWLEADEGCVKMHDLVRDVAIWIANDEIQTINLADKNRKALDKKEKNIRYLFCNDLQIGDMDVFPTWFDGTKLEILVICMEANDSVEVPNAFFEKMTRLRVLILMQTDEQMHALSLPFSVQSLTNLRSLILKNWKLGDISILGTLRSLEALYLDDCSISALPNKLTELEKLRLLSLESCEIERENPFEVIGRCLPLEELYFTDNKLSILDSVNEAGAIHQNTTFPALNRYRLLEDDKMDFLLMSNCVCLPYIDSLISEATFKYMVRGAETLQLEGIKGGWRNLIPDIVPVEEDEGMNDLVELGLESCSKVQCLVNNTQHIDSHVLEVFSKLVALRLESMDNLEELCSGPLPFEFLKSLERLIIKQCGHLHGIVFKSKLNLRNLKIMILQGCPMLASLFQLSTARSLVLLEELRICNCEQLTHIITEEEILDCDNDHKSYASMFPKLKTLEIKACHRLECILSVLFARDVPLLQSIKIVDCGELKHIFGRYQHDEEVKDVVLGSLQKMKLSGLPNFINIFQQCYPPMSSSVKRSSSRNVSKAKQPDPINRSIFPWSGICCCLHKCRPKLRNATSIKMPARDVLTECSTTLKPGAVVTHSSEISNRTALLQAVQNVEKIVVENSKIEGILQLPAELATNRKSDLLMASYIREINLANLPELMYICKGPIQSMSLQNLERVKVYKCNNLKCILSSCIAGGLPQLNELNVEHCDKLEQILQDEEIPEFAELPMESYQLEDCPKSPSNSSVTLQNAGPFNLCCLKRLILRSCSMLRSLFSPSTVISLTSLEELSIEECHGLRYLVANDRAHKNKRQTIQEDDDSRSYVSTFPKLKKMSVKKCSLLEYIFHISSAQGLVELKDIEIRQTPQLRYVFGQNTHSSHNYQNKIQIELPVLEKVALHSIPNMISICPDNCYVTCSSLRLLDMNDIGMSTLSMNNLMVDSGATHLDHGSTTDVGAASMTNGQISGSVKIWNSSKIEGIFLLEGFRINERQVTSWLTNLNLFKLPELSYIWRGAKHFVSLQNLYELHIWDCPKLKAIFSASVLRSLPQLKILLVVRCGQLEQIIEENEENENVSNCQSPKICFPQLKLLLVTQCQNLKRLFFMSTPHEFPELEILIINQDSRLQEVFEGEQGEREGRAGALLPKLKHVVLIKLANLNNICQGIEFQTGTNLLVHNCPKLSLTSTTSIVDMLTNYYDRDVDFFVRHELLYITDIITRETANKIPMPKITSQLHMSQEVQAVTESAVPSSKVNGSSQSMLNNLTGSRHEHNQIESGATESESNEFLASERENKGAQDLQLLEQKLPTIPSPNMIEKMQNIEETETAFTGEILESAKPAIPTSLETPLHKLHSSSCKLVDQESSGEPGFVGQQHALGETISIEDTVKDSVQEGSTSEEAVVKPCSTNQKKTLGETESTIEIPQIIKRGVEEGTTSNNDKIETSSTHIESASSHSGPFVTSQPKSYLQSEIRLNQIETYTDKSEGHHINIQDFGGNDLISSFVPVEEYGDGQILKPSISVVSADNLVVKVLVDLEESLKMPLKDIASSEANSLHLLRALNFLSRLPLEDATLSDRLKAIIDSMHQEFPSILCSFKKAFATTNKFAMLEAHRNEAAITLTSKISKAKNFMNEAQQKEAILKAELSSLQEKKKKYAEETIGYEKELETVRKDESQMVEDQRKTRHELFEVDYKWSALCSQFELNRIAARNPS